MPPVVRGIQAQGVIANAKHWVNNNQESARTSVSEVVDEHPHPNPHAHTLTLTLSGSLTPAERDACLLKLDASELHKETLLLFYDNLL